MNSEKNKSDLIKENRKTTGPVPIIRALFLTLIMKNPLITGYDILHMKPETMHTPIEMKTGTVYTELRRLERFGFVKSIHSQEGRKSRRYEITPLGIKELKAIQKQIQNRVNFLILPLLDLIESVFQNS